MKIAAYLRLMRLHKPAGNLLLWSPTAWALWTANQGAPALDLVAYFFLGTLFMRAAGCIVNDIADRHVDKHVKRTSLRPLTTGEVSILEALVLLIVLLFASFIIVIQLPITCFYYAMAALVITVVYPFCKRFFNAPQLVLGLAFSMGIPIAYAASGMPVNRAMMTLVVLNFAWIISYDTMYAMADRADDVRVGIKSTAVLFAGYDRLVLLLLQLLFHTSWLILAMSLPVSPLFYGFWIAALGILIYQQRLIRKREPDACLKAFSSNSWYGLLMWLAVL